MRSKDTTLNHEILASDSAEINYSYNLDNLASSKRQPLPIRARLKQLFRPAVRFGFRLIKPVLKPIAFQSTSIFYSRFKYAGYFQSIQHIATTTLQEIQIARNSLMREVQQISNVLAQNKQQSHEQTTATLQELQTAKDSIIQEVQHLSKDLAQNKQQLFELATTKTIQEIQAAKNSLMLEVQRLSKDLLQNEEQLFELATSKTIQEIQAARDTSMLEVQQISMAQTQIISHLPQLDRIEQYCLSTAGRVAIPSGHEEIIVKTKVGYLLCSANKLSFTYLLN